MSHLLADETILITPNERDVYRVKFFQDYHPENPWHDSDGMTPMVAANSERHGYHVTEHDSELGILNPFSYMTPAYAARHRKALFDLLKVQGQSFEEFEAECVEYGEGGRAQYRIEQFYEMLCDLTTLDKLATVAAVWRQMGVPAQVLVSRGYCQGDYTELLFVAHPRWVADIGFKTMHAYIKTCGDTFEADRDVFGAWAWGGVIGHVCDRLDPSELGENVDLNALEPVEQIDSCWGHYPDGAADYFPLKENFAYLIDELKKTCQYDAKQRQLARQSRLATMIKNHVPLNVRADELAKLN